MPRCKLRKVSALEPVILTSGTGRFLILDTLTLRGFQSEDSRVQELWYMLLMGRVGFLALLWNCSIIELHEINCASSILTFAEALIF